MKIACELKEMLFLYDSVVFLGFIVSAEGLKPEPSKLEAILE